MDSDSMGEDTVSNVLSEALSSNDKVIEIRPANQSSGMGLSRLLLLGVAAIGVAYWVQNSQKPKEIIGNVKEETASRTQEAAETIEKGSETASQRIEAGSDRAGDAVEEAGETVADRTEEAGEKAADEAEKSSSSSSTSGTSSSSKGSSSSSKRSSGTSSSSKR